jgi:PAT family beta-lactamase induction signal transducer AmpG
MWKPDLLATKWGRLAAFSCLYLTEGIPLGFTAVAVATQMRRQGVGVAEVGAFVASLYLPWAWKWAFGPFVDVVTSDRWGRRRTWIVLAQSGMILTLLAALPVDFSGQLRLFTFIILIHNVFAAVQDVAIDALAVGVLREEERGLANGLMFGGAYLGQAIGGAGVLFLTSWVDFRWTFLFVIAWIAAVTLFVGLPLREAKGTAPPPTAGHALAVAGRRIGAFIGDAFRAFIGSRGAFVGLIFALLPAGAYALGLALQTNLAVELGMSDASIGWLSLWSTVISAAGCVAGGWLSDRFGRRRMLAAYLVGTALPTLYLAWAMQAHGWIMPIDPQSATRPVAPAALLLTFWTACLVYAVFQGLMYGTRTALFMDVTTPAVAATQFTAYMALLNFVIAYSARWQGLAAEAWGYPTTLLADAVAGLFCIALLPLMTPVRTGHAELPAEAIPEGVQP